MSVSAAHAAAFYSEALKDQHVYAVRDDGGFPAPLGRSGRRAMPFWSKRSRAQKIIDSVPAYREFTVVEIGLADWIEKWLTDLQQDGIEVGMNWSGRFATGYEIPQRTLCGTPLPSAD
jgi:hypothetical protein